MHHHLGEDVVFQAPKKQNLRYCSLNSCAWMYETLKNNGINYQPQLVSRISEPSTVCNTYLGKLLARCSMYGLSTYTRWKMATFKGKWQDKYSHPMEHLGYNSINSSSVTLPMIPTSFPFWSFSPQARAEILRRTQDLGVPTVTYPWLFGSGLGRRKGFWVFFVFFWSWRLLRWVGGIQN